MNRDARKAMIAAATAGIGFLLTGGAPTAGADSGTWVSTSDPNWSNGANWDNGTAPQYAGDTANFFGQATQTAIALDGDFTVGGITFSNAASYSISPASPGDILTLDNGPQAASLMDLGGAHTLAAPVMLNSNATIAVLNPGDSLLLSGPVSGAGGVTVLGGGTVNLAGSNTYSGATTVKSGTLAIGSAGALPSGAGVQNNASLDILSGTSAAPVVAAGINGNGSLSVGTAGTAAYLQLAAGAGPSQQSSVAISAGSTLDITDNELVINYGSAADPVAAIQAALKSGAAFGASGSNYNSWNGTGIVSSTVAAAASSNMYNVGYLDGNNSGDNRYGDVGANQILVEYTVQGNAFLENSVGNRDLQIVAANFGTGSGMDWADGSFDYSGSVGNIDLQAVAAHFDEINPQNEELGSPTGIVGLAWNSGQAVTTVPEPGGMALAAAIGSAFALSRRVRRMPNPCAAKPAVGE